MGLSLACADRCRVRGMTLNRLPGRSAAHSHLLPVTAQAALGSRLPLGEEDSETEVWRLTPGECVRVQPGFSEG